MAVDVGTRAPDFTLVNKDRESVTLTDHPMGLRGTAKRAVFLIDQSGIVRYREVLSDVHNEPDYNSLRKGVASP